MHVEKKDDIKKNKQRKLAAGGIIAAGSRVEWHGDGRRPTDRSAGCRKKRNHPAAVKVKATRDNKSGNYKAGTSTVGTKTDTPLIETPQSISVITNDQMEAQNVSTMA
jgi:hypothetical protein